MNYLCILAIVINVFQMLSGRNFPRKRKFYRVIALHTRRSVYASYRKCTTAETTRTRTRAKVVISCSTFSNADHGYCRTTRVLVLRLNFPGRLKAATQRMEARFGIRKMAAPYADHIHHIIVGSYSVFARWHHLHRSVSKSHLVVNASVHGIVCMHVKNKYIYNLLHEKNKHLVISKSLLIIICRYQPSTYKFKTLFLTRPSDRAQIWHACADRDETGSHQKN